MHKEVVVADLNALPQNKTIGAEAHHDKSQS